MVTPEELRFFAKLTPDPRSGCLLWLGAVGSNGYGRFYYQGRIMHAHRAAYAMAHGEIPKGLHVLHRCDRPLCVKPDHLFLGTNADNIADKVAKGRSTKGSRNPRAILKESQVLSILKRRGSHAQVGAQFGVTARTVQAIRLGSNWAWLTKVGKRGIV